MAENIFRELGAREGQNYDLNEVIRSAAKDVDRPIFYSVAVIIAGYLPIYALSGPSGKLFKPMADTVAIALVGALIFTLTLVPVLCSYWFKKGVHERENKPFEWVRNQYSGMLEWCLDRPGITMIVSTAIFAITLLLVRFHRRRDSLPPPGRGRIMGSSHHALYRFLRDGQQVLAPGA